MNKWIVEDWEFEITVTEGKAEQCRSGLEKGDKFTFQYEFPANFCPRALIELFTWCEVIRCGGDFTHRGYDNEKYKMDMHCPCQCIKFSLAARQINRNENGVYIGNSEKPK